MGYGFFVQVYSKREKWTAEILRAYEAAIEEDSQYGAYCYTSYSMTVGDLFADFLCECHKARVPVTILPFFDNESEAIFQSDTEEDDGSEGETGGAA